MKVHRRTAFLALIFLLQLTAYAARDPLKGVRVLLYTRNGVGYVHDNIPYARECLQKQAKLLAFTLDETEDPAVFSYENLRRYQLVVFASTNNDVFANDEQRLAFRRYIESGGGFVGIHSVVGTERNWPWFRMLAGGSFAWHPRFQTYDLHVLRTDHPSVKGVPVLWRKADECYFMKELFPGIQTLVVHDLRTLSPATEQEREKIVVHKGWYGDFYPAVWCHDFDGGVVWITALGHDKKDYQDEVFINHVVQGMRYVADRTRNLRNVPYATSANEEVIGRSR